MKTQSLLALCGLWLFATAAAHGVTFKVFPSLVFVERAAEVDVKVSVDPGSVSNPAGILTVTASTGGSLVTFPVNPVSGRNEVFFKVRGTSTPGVNLTTSVTLSCMFDPDGPEPAMSGTTGFNVFVVNPSEGHASNSDARTAGDPVSTRTGEYFALEGVDLNLGGPMPLFFSRYYSSRFGTDSRTSSSFAQNRLHNFESRVVFAGARQVDVITNRGRVISFEKTGTVWTLIKRLDIPFRLIERAGEFVLGDPHSQQMWTYDSTSGRLLRIEDGCGNTHTLTYNDVAPIRLQQVADGLGRRLSFTYNGTGRLITVTDHTERHVDFGHTGTVLTSVTDPLGHTTTYTHAGTLLTSTTRPEGNVPFTQAYTSNKVTSQTERGTDTRMMAYAANSTTLTDPMNATLVDTYDAKGELTSHTDAAGRTITTTSDATGRRNSVADREGDTTKTVYHELSGKPAVITNAEGRSVTMAYKARVLNGITFFDLASVTFTDGTRETYIHDKFGNLLSRTDPAGKIWKFTYNDRGQA